MVHIITSLDDGGAEAVLYRLCLADKRDTHIVISLRGKGKYSGLLAEADIACDCLDMPRGLVTPRGVWKMYRLLRRVRPDVVQTWMYHANLAGGLIARLAGIRCVIWGLHHTTLDPRNTKRTTIWIARLNARLSRWLPRRIVSCSEVGVAVHTAAGYAAEKFQVIANGYDLSCFAPDAASRRDQRAHMGASDAVPLLGMVARFDAQKDHRNLIGALAILNNKGIDFRCAFVGTDMTDSNIELVEWLCAEGVRNRVILMGHSNDIPAVMNALDLNILSSAYGEAFPNVLCEAMACGKPCVTTRVGDAALIVGETGWVVPPRSPEALARAIVDALLRKQADPQLWSRRCELARQRILQNFSIATMVTKYRSVWTEDRYGC